MNHSITFPTYTTKTIQLILGVALLFAASQISIEIKPVPITLQTVAIMLIGLTYSPKLAFTTIASWIIGGVAGLPMFVHFNAGLAELLGPKGGYLVGFLVAGTLMAYLKQRVFYSNSYLYTALNCVVGSAIIYTFGVSWLAKFFGWSQAINLGLIPFIIPGIIKIFLLSAAIKLCKIK
jgi:biotin transport system substrate-specific component